MSYFMFSAEPCHIQRASRGLRGLSSSTGIKNTTQFQEKTDWLKTIPQWAWKAWVLILGRICLVFPKISCFPFLFVSLSPLPIVSFFFLTLTQRSFTLVLYSLAFQGRRYRNKWCVASSKLHSIATPNSSQTNTLTNKTNKTCQKILLPAGD